jgi:MFS transporter, DHA2 family, multidrug resistance protein
VIDRRNDFHTSSIRQSLTANSVIGQDRMAASTANFFAQGGDMAHAKMQALGQLATQISQQAIVMTYSETFYMLAIALLACLPLALLLKTPKPGRGDAPSAGH